MSEKEIFIRNRQRALQDKFGGKHERYHPEHERLNHTPEEAFQVTEDFRYAKRFPLTVPKKPALVSQHAPQQFCPSNAIASGHNEELSWIPREVLRHDEDPNQSSISYDEVPHPPRSRNVEVIPADPPLQSESRVVNIDDISEGNYFIVVGDTIVAEASELQLIEELVEDTIFDSSNNISLGDIVVLRKMKIKVGVGVS